MATEKFLQCIYEKNIWREEVIILFCEELNIV